MKLENKEVKEVREVTRSNPFLSFRFLLYLLNFLYCAQTFSGESSNG